METYLRLRFSSVAVCSPWLFGRSRKTDHRGKERKGGRGGMVKDQSIKEHSEPEDVGQPLEIQVGQREKSRPLKEIYYQNPGGVDSKGGSGES